MEVPGTWKTSGTRVNGRLRVFYRLITADYSTGHDVVAVYGDAIEQAGAGFQTQRAGDQSVPHLRDSVRAVDEVLEDSRLVEFDGVGHVFNETAPDRVASELRSFVARARP